MSNLKFDPFTADIGPIFAPVELEGFPGLEHQRYIGAAPGCLLCAVPFVTPSAGKSRHAFIGAVISQLHQISMHLRDFRVWIKSQVDNLSAYGASLLGRLGVLNFGSTAPSRRYFFMVLRD